MQHNDPPSAITRFAPSPTGHLHLGHAYAAGFARDLATELGGEYLLRFEDIDTTRVRPQFYASILDDLQWLGIQHSGSPLKQLDRLNYYESALEKLKQLQVIYPCFCSRKDIRRELKSITHAPHEKAQHYPLTCRSLSDMEITSHLATGAVPAWRINCDIAREITGHLSFQDLSHGEYEVQHDLLGDAILARKDIGTSYHIAVVVDDALQQISHVTRGVDLLDSTHLHRVLQDLLDLPRPIYQHHKLIRNDTGERLAKRVYSETIQSLRKQGYSKTDILQMIDF